MAAEIKKLFLEDCLDDSPQVRSKLERWLNCSNSLLFRLELWSICLKRTLKC